MATALSIAIMIVSLAVVTGFEDVIREKLYSFTGHVHVSYYSPVISNAQTQPPIYRDPKLIAAIQRLPHVVQVANGHMEGIALKGTDKSYKLPSSLSFSGKQITFPDSGYAHEIILSEKIADRLGVKTGDKVQLEYIGVDARPRLRMVVVSGLFHSGMEEVDKFFGLCDIRLLQRLNNWS